MGLSLVVGPAHAGKVALLLERYLDALERDPWLIVPNRGDVERVERDLLRRRPALLAGHIATFDDLFAHIAAGDSDLRPVATDAQSTIAVRRAVARTSLESIGRVRGVEGLRGLAARESSASSSPRSSIPNGSAETSVRSRPRMRRSSTGWRSGTATGSGDARRGASRRTSTRGTARRCSRTGSRT